MQRRFRQNRRFGISHAIAVASVLSLLTVALAVACGGSSPELDALEAEAAYARGVELREQGQMRNAFDAFNDALRLNPRYGEAYAARASVYYAFGDQQNTIADLNAALRLEPEIAEAYYYRGLIFTDKGDSDNALINFTRALQLAPSSDAYFERARVYFALQDLDAAIGDLSAAIDMEQRAGHLYLLRGEVHLIAERTELGIADLERALELTDDEGIKARAKQILALVR